jgi:hypothetical protein
LAINKNTSNNLKSLFFGKFPYGTMAWELIFNSCSYKGGAQGDRKADRQEEIE